MNINDSRRGFAKMLGLAGAAGAATLFSKDALAQSSSTPSTAMDIAILNFALNLEYLEAEFYTMGTSGMSISQMGISITGSGNAGTTTGGRGRGGSKPATANARRIHRPKSDAGESQGVDRSL